MVIALSLHALVVWAQPTIQVETNTQAFTTAEPVQVVVTITGKQEHRLVLQADSLGSWLILDHPAPVFSQLNGAFVTTEKLLLTSFDSGDVRLPPLYITGIDSAYPTGLVWQVMPPPADSLKDYRPIKEWEPVTDKPMAWWWVTALAVLVLLLLAGLWYWWHKRRNKSAVNPLPPSAKTLENEWQRLLKTWQKGELSSEALGNGWMEIFRKKSGLQRSTNQSLAAFELVNAYKKMGRGKQLDELILYLTICQAAQFGKLTMDATTGEELITFGRKFNQQPTPPTAT